MSVSVGTESGGQRDARGRFQRGCKPGPGAPKNQHTAAVQAVREAALEHGLPCLIEAARGGDIEAAKALCGLGLPKLRPVSIMERVPVGAGRDVGEKAADVFRAICNGGLTHDTAATLIAALRVFAEAAQLSDLQARLEAVEEKALHNMPTLGVASWTQEKVVPDEVEESSTD